MTDGDAAPGSWRFRKVVGDRIVQAQTALFREHHDGSGSELLADRSRLVDGAVARQGPELDVGIAVAATEQHAVAPENRQRETGNVLSGELGANIAFDGIDGSGLGSRGSGERECG